jgi:predicted dehydrogenase
LNVVALCDLRRSVAEQRRNVFFPEADVYDDYRLLLKRSDIEVVDIATHPPERAPIIADALDADKHVLSQKPFVVDLDVGRRLCDQADKRGRVLAVNQNGRWAPHFCFLRNAVRSGLIGQAFSAHMSVHWDHTWVKGTAFEHVKHLVLYDFAIHWFDMLRCLLPDSQPKLVYASTGRMPNQSIMPNLLGQCLIEWDQAQSSLTFDAGVPFGPQERTFVGGTKGSLYSSGADYQSQEVVMVTEVGEFRPKLTGKWFSDGFGGTMGELLCSIEEGRPCSIAARDNLTSLALCFAAVASAEWHRPVKPFEVTQLVP